jgi:hypothetical protein
MDSQFIEYVQKYPKQYAIAKSELCINLIEYLSEHGATIKELLSEEKYHKITEEDLTTLLEMLVIIKLLDKVTTGSKTIYYSGQFTNQFLKKYYGTKKEYDI